MIILHITQGMVNAIQLEYHSIVCMRSHRLYSWDPAEHLRFVNPCNFRRWTDLSAAG